MTATETNKMKPPVCIIGCRKNRAPRCTSPDYTFFVTVAISRDKYTSGLIATDKMNF